MIKIANLDNSKERPPLSSLLLLLGIVLLSMVFGNFIGGAFMLFICKLGFNDISNLNATIMSSKNGWWAMMIAQGLASFLTFIAAGTFYWRVVEKKRMNDFNWRKFPPLKTLTIIFLIQICFIPLSGWIQNLNENMDLPDFLEPVERFMKSMEDNLAELTKFITTFNSNAQLFTALLIIAVFAGVGEELVFRGIVQRKFYIAFKNPHLAIWLSAFIFSAIHLQFYGFFPRMLLGAMFGYFYFWTGNLWVPILGHIFNNGLALILIHLVHLKKVSPDVEKLDIIPLPILLISFTLFASLIYYLTKSENFENSNE